MKHISRSVVLFFYMVCCIQGFSQTCNMYVGGYVPSYRPAGTIDYSKVSHVFYAFAGANPSGNLILDSSIAGNFSAFKTATFGKSRYLSLEGGDTVQTIKNIAGIPSARANLELDVNYSASLATNTTDFSIQFVPVNYYESWFSFQGWNRSLFHANINRHFSITSSCSRYSSVIVLKYSSRCWKLVW